MTETTSVSPEMCSLHREVIEAKLLACNERVDGILEELKGVRDLQKQILYTLIFLSVGVSLTLFGVLIGRGVDFGWLVP